MRSTRVLVALMFGFVTFFDSWDSIAVAFVAPLIAKEWQIGPAIIGLVFAAGYAGQFVGAVSSGAFAERWGRVRMLVVFGALMCVLAGACALASSPAQLIALRFAQGIGVGAVVPISVSYLIEIAPTATRGRFISLFQFVTSAGFAAASGCSVWIVPELGWRWMFGAGLTPLVILPAILLLVPESPLWLASKGRMDAARRATAWLGLEEDGAAAPKIGLDAPDGRHGYAAIFRPVNLRATLSTSALWFLNAYIGFGMVSWLPSIYVSIYKMPIERALRYNSISYAAYLLVPLLVALLIDRIGRRRLSIACVAFAMLAFFGLIVLRSPSEAVLVSLATIAQNAAAGCLVIMWTYTGEVFSTDIRSVASGFAISWARVASMIAPAVIGAVFASSGSVSTIFTMFIGCGLLLLCLWIFVARETGQRVIF